MRLRRQAERIKGLAVVGGGRRSRGQRGRAEEALAGVAGKASRESAVGIGPEADDEVEGGEETVEVRRQGCIRK